MHAACSLHCMAIMFDLYHGDPVLLPASTRPVLEVQVDVLRPVFVISSDTVSLSAWYLYLLKFDCRRGQRSSQEGTRSHEG